jgi:predicted DNA-binding protein (MmcQ/YjbR family)
MPILSHRELIALCLALPAAYEDYPFGDDAGWCVIRHRANKKGFAHIFERNGRLCVNLKCDPFEADFLRQAYADVTPAYHMNKVHWNTIAVGGKVPLEELGRMIQKSHGLTAPKVRKPK